MTGVLIVAFERSIFSNLDRLIVAPVEDHLL
jgi:hypothetical protein